MPNQPALQSDDGPASVSRRGAAVERTCIVTRQAMPVDALVRFVVAPDGSVVADLKRRLPGRGVWVSADAAHVREAERKRLFARAFKAPVTVDPGLAERVGDMLTRAALQSLSLARKAGGIVTGFAKVEAAIARDPVIALIHASDGAADGVAKIAAAARRRFGAGGEPVVIRCFSSEQLDLAFGRTNVIHAAVLAGPASDNMVARVQALARFTGGEQSWGAADRPFSDRPLSE